MATANQIYAMVNDAAEESLGSAAITVKDTATLVSLGDVVLSSATNKDAFYKALVDRIGRTVVAIRQLQISKRSVKRDEMDWGIVYQKISFKHKEAVANASWDDQSQASPYDIEISTEMVQKLFTVLATWSYEDSIPEYQMFTAFTSAEKMGALIAGIKTNMENEMAIAEMNNDNLAVDTYMAGALIGSNNAQKRNLLAEFNLIAETPITVAEALTNPEFLRYATYQINLTIKNMKAPSVMFNSSDDIIRQTMDDKMVVEVLSNFAAASASFLQSDTYHKELVSIPRYEEVTYWQAPGTAFGFDDVSKIHVKNAQIGTDSNPTGEVEQSGIIAFVHDYDAVASIIYRRRDYSKFNERSERMNIMMKADMGYAVDLTENGVVFYIAE